MKTKNQHHKPEVLTQLGIALWLLCIVIPCRATDPPSEYRIKSDYLFNFSNFTTLPDSHFTSNGRTYDLCIVGSNPFGKFLEPLVSRSVGNRPLQLHFLDADHDLSVCEAAFISKSASGNLGRILKQADEFDILTISDIEGFAYRGGMIGFITYNNRISFQINRTTAQHNNIHISSKLLELGELVDTKARGE